MAQTAEENLLRAALSNNRDLVNELLDYFLPGEIRELNKALEMMQEEIFKKGVS